MTFPGCSNIGQFSESPILHSPPIPRKVCRPPPKAICPLPGWDVKRRPASHMGYRWHNMYVCCGGSENRRGPYVCSGIEVGGLRRKEGGDETLYFSFASQEQRFSFPFPVLFLPFSSGFAGNPNSCVQNVCLAVPVRQKESWLTAPSLRTFVKKLLF